MDWEKRIVIDPRVLAGKPVIKGTRVPVEVVVGSLASGMTVEQVCQDYQIAAEDVRAALTYAADVLADERVHALPPG